MAVTLHESGENYLEAILILEQARGGGAVRSIDVAARLEVSKPSVSRAVSILKASGYLSTPEDGALVLTETGRAAASRIYERHRVLTDLLLTLGVSQAQAAADACLIEHDLSDESFQRIKEHMEKMKQHGTN